MTPTTAPGRRRSIWDPVHIGIDETGAPVHLNVGERNVLIGGESGGGKSVALQLLVAHAALAFDCSLVLFDGKLVELGLWRECAERFVAHRSIDDAIEVNHWLQNMINDRAEWLLDRKRRKITPDMGLQFYLSAIDEYAYFSTVIKGTKAQRTDFEDTSRDIAARGRFVGIIPILATQRPSHQVINPSLRDLFGYRWAFRCSTSASSDCILGQGWATAGYDASDETLISPLARGVSLLRAEDGKPRRIKTAYLSDDQIVTLAAQAARIRASARTPEGAAV
jgi:DNA segregation ATPase FtsK/SpoIIIE, S-DNA-T family